MKTIKKIILVLLILLVAYILIVFMKPELAKSIGGTIGLGTFNEKLVEVKGKLDNVSLNQSGGLTLSGDISTGIESIDNTISGAIDASNTVVNTIDTTKQKIDNIRETANTVEKQYNEVKTKVEETKKVVDDASKVVNSVSNIVNGSGATK